MRRWRHGRRRTLSSRMGRNNVSRPPSRGAAFEYVAAVGALSDHAGGLDGRCWMKIEVKKLEKVIATSGKPS